MIILSTLQNPVMSNFIEFSVGRASEVDKDGEVVFGQVVEIKEEEENSLKGEFWVYSEKDERFFKKVL